jgi:hypothetical protein
MKQNQNKVLADEEIELFSKAAYRMTKPEIFITLEDTKVEFK